MSKLCKTNLKSDLIGIRDNSGSKSPIANRMRSFAFIRNVIVLCVYSIYQSIDKYPLFCEVGIAVAVAIIQVIVDHFRLDDSMFGISDQNTGQFAIVSFDPTG